MQIAEIDPEAVYRAGRRLAVEQHIPATTWPDPIPQYAAIPPMSNCSEQSAYRRGARRFAEAHPEIVNHYARYGESCKNNVSSDVGRLCDWCLTGRNLPYTPEAYRAPVAECKIPTTFSYSQKRRQGSSGTGCQPAQPSDLCQDCSHRVSWGCGSYRDPLLMGMPGSDGLLHDESCIQAHGHRYCSCHNCEERTRGRAGSSNGSYTRERASNWPREV